MNTMTFSIRHVSEYAIRDEDDNYEAPIYYVYLECPLCHATFESKSGASFLMAEIARHLDSRHPDDFQVLRSATNMPYGVVSRWTCDIVDVRVDIRSVFVHNSIYRRIWAGEDFLSRKIGFKDLKVAFAVVPRIHGT